MPKSAALGSFHVFVWVQALVLVVAAVLKAWLVFTDSFADLRTGYPITILLLAIVLELGVAGFLFFGRDVTSKWLVLAGMFSLFLCISLVRYSMGIAGCGCLGSIELPRWLLPVNSVFVLAGLLVFAFHHRSRDLFQFRSTSRDLISRSANPGILGGVVSLLLLVGALTISPWVRSFPIVTSFIGEAPIPAVRFSAGDLAVGESVELAIPWTNCTSEKVTFVGSQSSCTCVGLNDSRLLAHPTEQIELKISVRPRKPGLFHQRIVCFVDHPSQDRLTLDVIANAVLPHKEN